MRRIFGKLIWDTL